MRDALSYMDDFNLLAGRDVKIKVEYIVAPDIADVSAELSGRMGVLREKLPAHLAGMEELERLHHKTDRADMHNRLVEEARRQFWQDVFGAHKTLRHQEFYHEITENVPVDILKDMRSRWKEQRDQIARDIGPEKLEQLIAQEEDFIRKVLESVAGDKPGMLRLNFLSAMSKGYEPAVLIEEKIPFPRTQNFLKHFLTLDAVMVSANVVHTPSWDRTNGDIGSVSDFKLG